MFKRLNGVWAASRQDDRRMSVPQSTFKLHQYFTPATCSDCYFVKGFEAAAAFGLTLAT
jgi:hypothetical protein